MRVPLLLATLVGAAALAACGDDERAIVDGYVTDVNAIQRRAAPAFKRAQEAYVAFSRDSMTTPRVQRQLAGAERSMRATRAELARLDPPDDAAELHRRVLRVYDMSAGLAHETVLLGRYLPASAAALKPLPAATRRLEKGLRADAGTAGQRRTLRRYADSTQDVLDDLRPLDPPPLVAVQHDAQVDQLESARSLAVRLDKAIGRGDAKQVARLLLRFRRLGGGAASLRRRAADALASYQERYRTITQAQTDVHREVGRLERSLD